MTRFTCRAIRNREIGEFRELTWAARRKTSVEIAQILDLAKRTVDFHIDNARLKLGVATRIQAAIKAANCPLIEP
jgi:DNA-binding CsgD family transcriptional regulator